jgi:hypothetical protein
MIKTLALARLQSLAAQVLFTEQDAKDWIKKNLRFSVKKCRLTNTTDDDYCITVVVPKAKEQIILETLQTKHNAKPVRGRAAGQGPEYAWSAYAWRDPQGVKMQLHLDHRPSFKSFIDFFPRK